MAWVTGIKQVTLFQPERDGKSAIPKPVRVVSSLLPHAIERTVQPRTALPENTSAGVCGTHARRESVQGVMVWSIFMLIGPLQVWYEKQNRPRNPLSRAGIQIGAKSGGGNGRCELW